MEPSLFVGLFGITSNLTVRLPCPDGFIDSIVALSFCEIAPTSGWVENSAIFSYVNLSKIYGSNLTFSIPEKYLYFK
jgi:hypothetical protein